LPLYALLRRYTLAVIGAAETAADLAGVIRTQQMPGGMEPAETEPMDEVEITRRMLLTLPRGHDITQIKAEQPTTTYDAFKIQIIAEIARCLNMPRNVAAGDSSNFNYSSARLDWRTYEGAIRIERSQWEWTACTPTLQRWWEEARFTPEIQALGFDRSSPLPKHSWAWDASIEIDPNKAATARQTNLATLTTTLQREYAKEGLNWETELRQRAREESLKRTLKLTAAPPPAPEPSPPEPSPADDPTEEDTKDAADE
jgi:capsid protein